MRTKAPPASTIADVYIVTYKSPFYGMAPASGHRVGIYRLGGRCYA